MARKASGPKPKSGKSGQRKKGTVRDRKVEYEKAKQRRKETKHALEVRSIIKRRGVIGGQTRDKFQSHPLPTLRPSPTTIFHFDNFWAGGLTNRLRRFAFKQKQPVHRW